MCAPLASSARYRRYTAPSFTTAAGLKVACSSHRTMVSLREERNRDAGPGVIAGFTALGFSKGPNIHCCPGTAPGEGAAGGGQLLRRQAVRARQLVQIRPRHHEARGPDELRLVLGIQVVEMHQLGGVDLILGDEPARPELEDVEPARDLGAHDVA